MKFKITIYYIVLVLFVFGCESEKVSQRAPYSPTQEHIDEESEVENGGGGFNTSSPSTECLHLVPSVTDTPSTTYHTKNVIIVVIDGPRYSETWGDPSHQYIPNMHYQLASEGVIGRQFHNRGRTLTMNGHTAISTGCYENLYNNGSESPDHPSIFQLWRQRSEAPAEKAWIIGSKDKVAALGNCKNEDWAGQYLPSLYCGHLGGGLSSGYADDQATIEQVWKTLDDYEPNLVLINLKEPDFSGHNNDWGAYLQGIRDGDQFAADLWNYIQSHEYYANTTTLIITNDHGRHLDGVSSGFVGHGDQCTGCTHINLFAAGPDFKTNVRIDHNYELIQIAPTVAELMGFSKSGNENFVMWGLFK